jgi:inorganic pyrophosphatase
MDSIIHTSELVIDRPKGSVHPRYPSSVYPLDYGYLKGTSAPDGMEIDVWRGSQPGLRFDAAVCTVDRMKRDAEIKLLLGCTEAEKAIILDFYATRESMAGILIRREME